MHQVRGKEKEMKVGTCEMLVHNMDYKLDEWRELSLDDAMAELWHFNLVEQVGCDIWMSKC